MLGIYSVVASMFALAGIIFYGAVHYITAYFDVAFPWPEVCGNIFMMCAMLIWTHNTHTKKAPELTASESAKSLSLTVLLAVIWYGARYISFEILAGLIPATVPFLTIAKGFTNGMFLAVLALSAPQRNQFVLKYFPDKISNE